MNVFSLRAERPSDVEDFLAEAKRCGVELRRTIQRTEPPFPDAELEFRGPANLKQVTAVLANVERGNVMLDTIKMGPLPPTPF